MAQHQVVPESAKKRTNRQPAAARLAAPTTQAASPIAVLRMLDDPLSASPSDILAVQQRFGNRAVQRLIQAKLTVGPAGDHYEQEADRVAQQVMTMPAPAQTQPTIQRAVPRDEEEVQMKPLAASSTPVVQRAVEEEEELQMKPLALRVQRAEEDEEELQTKPEVQRASSRAGFEVAGEFEQQLAASRSGGSPLPAEVRSFMEPRFGADFSRVRLHTGSEAAQLNREVSAQAFTLGQDIFMGEGKSNFESSEGQRLLAHELAHTIQQSGLSQVKQDAGPSQPRVAGVISGLQREVIQRSENEDRLIWENWRVASYKKWKSRGELAKIDAAVKAYGKIGAEEENPVRRLLAVQKICDVTEEFINNHPLRGMDPYRGVINLADAAAAKRDELQAQRRQDFQKPEVQEARIREIAPSFYDVKEELEEGSLEPADAAERIFSEFIAYPGFVYTTATSSQTINTGFYRGSCEDFSSALAELFNELGIEAGTRRLTQRNFITTPATSFIDKNCPGNIKTRGKNYAAVKRFFFDSHTITTTTACGDFDPTAGVRGEVAVAPDLVGFVDVKEKDKRRCGLKGNESGLIKDHVLLKERPTEVAPTGGMTYEMKTI